MSPDPNPITIPSVRLAARLRGKVSFPSDTTYENSRQAWNRTTDQRPAMIVYVENPLDVIEAVTFARQHRLPIAVQSTGHGLKRAADGAMLINTSRITELRIDLRTHTAWVGAGVKWGQVLEHSQNHGLAPALGSSPNIGAVGFTLGGGMGWLARKHGLGIDSVLSLDVVTADGTFRHVSPEENSDLFWAMRGGGGGFGVVTAMQVRLYPVAQVYAGNLYYPANRAEDMFRHFQRWAETAPDELSASIVLMNYPHMHHIPAPLRGRSFVIVRGCCCGSIKEGQALIDYWRDWQVPAFDDFQSMRFARSAEISLDPPEPGMYPQTSGWLSDLSEEAASLLIKHTLPWGAPPPITFSEVRLAGGAIARVDPDASAYAHRSERFLWVSAATAANPAALEPVREHFRLMHSVLAPHLSGRVYLNMVNGEEARRRTRDGFSEPVFLRLQAVKAKYDPDNVFDYAFDIPPAKITPL